MGAQLIQIHLLLCPATLTLSFLIIDSPMFKLTPLPQSALDYSTAVSFT